MTTTRSDVSAGSSDSRDGSDVAMSASDKYIRRCSVSRSLFSSSNLSSPSTTPIRDRTTPGAGTGGAGGAGGGGGGNQPPMNPPYTRQHTYPFVDKRYVLNMFSREVDRKFVHLFLRESGIYLVAISLKDMIEDPIIQFENLSFWLRLIQTFVRPVGIKRVMIVGMCDGPMNGPRERECLSNLEGAIREADFPQVYNKDGIHVVMFDRRQPEASMQHLCKSVSKCMDALMTRAWFVDSKFFEKVFQPFTGLTEVLSSMSQSRETLMSPESLLSIYQIADIHYFDTLAAHSSALVSDKGEFLLFFALSLSPVSLFS